MPRADPGRRAATQGRKLAKGAVRAVDAVLSASHDSPEALAEAVERTLLGAIQQGHGIGSELAGSDQVRVISSDQHKALAKAIRTAVESDSVPVLVRSEVQRSTVEAFTESTAAKFGKRKLDFVIKTDSANACAKCKAQAGEKVKLWKSWRGNHVNCGCYLMPQPKSTRRVENDRKYQ